MLTFTTFSLPSISLEMSSSEGPIMRHGPHHSAQKSTSTGVSDFRTSCSKETSVALTVIGVLQKHYRPVDGPAPPLGTKLGTAVERVKTRKHKALIFRAFQHRFPSIKGLLSTAEMPLRCARDKGRRAACDRARVVGGRRALQPTRTQAAAGWSCSRRSALRAWRRPAGRPGR